MMRPDPFDLVFEPLVEHFAAIRAEVQASGGDVADPTAFAALPEAQRLLDRVESPGLIEHTPDAAREYLILLYVAYRFWDAGCTRVAVDRAAIERALTADPDRDTSSPPPGAWYVRFPHQWFWAQVDPEAPHEPLDGIFVATSAAPREPHLTIAAVLGLRPERGGFSQITATTTGSELSAARDELASPLFAPRMAGGDQAGFRSFATRAELLVLAQLALRCAAQ